MTAKGWAVTIKIFSTVILTLTSQMLTAMFGTDDKYRCQIS